MEKCLFDCGGGGEAKKHIAMKKGGRSMTKEGKDWGYQRRQIETLCVDHRKQRRDKLRREGRQLHLAEEGKLSAGLVRDTRRETVGHIFWRAHTYIQRERERESLGHRTYGSLLSCVRPGAHTHTCDMLTETIIECLTQTWNSSVHSFIITTLHTLSTHTHKPADSDLKTYNLVGKKEK